MIAQATLAMFMAAMVVLNESRPQQITGQYQNYYIQQRGTSFVIDGYGDCSWWDGGGHIDGGDVVIFWRATYRDSLRWRGEYRVDSGGNLVGGFWSDSGAWVEHTLRRGPAPCVDEGDEDLVLRAQGPK